MSKIKYPDATMGRYPKGTFQRIKKVLGREEDRTAFFREAAEMLLKKRERKL